MDKEYQVLELIEKSINVTQREISEQLEMSLGSVNLLVAKMVREDLVKIEKIPANRVAYMLTPKGVHEKLTKTIKYIKIHYQYIETTKQTISKW